MHQNAQTERPGYTRVVMREPGVELLLELLTGARRDEVAGIADLGPRLRSQLEAVRAEHAAMDSALYLHALAGALARRHDEPAVRVLDTLPAVDLYLAAACLAGQPAAIAELHSTLLPVVRAALRKLAIAPAIVDEAEQRTLVAILVGDPVRPALATYSGRGRLRSWVRSIGVRIGRRSAGKAAAGGASVELDRVADLVADPTLAVLRERYRDVARAAIATAVAGLPARQRTVLRQYYVDELTIDRLAAIYRVDRATTARWLVAARAAILEGTRVALGTELGGSTTEIDSILNLVGSGLELSLRDLR